jgi:hypothetical protein
MSTQAHRKAGIRQVRLVGVAALLMLVVAALTASPAGAATAPTITNFDAHGHQVVRFDTAGNAIDAHDGGIVRFSDAYYLYGTSYNCGFTLLETGTPWCGIAVYRSTDLVHWSPAGPGGGHQRQEPLPRRLRRDQRRQWPDVHSGPGPRPQIPHGGQRMSAGSHHVTAGRYPHAARRSRTRRAGRWAAAGLAVALIPAAGSTAAGSATASGGSFRYLMVYLDEPGSVSISDLRLVWVPDVRSRASRNRGRVTAADTVRDPRWWYP